MLFKHLWFQKTEQPDIWPCVFLTNERRGKWGKPVWIQSFTAMLTVSSGADITQFSFKTHPVFLPIKFTAWAEDFWCIWMQGMISHFDNKTINAFLYALYAISRHCSLTWLEHACSWDVFISLDHCRMCHIWELSKQKLILEPPAMTVCACLWQVLS